MKFLTEVAVGLLCQLKATFNFLVLPTIYFTTLWFHVGKKHGSVLPQPSSPSSVHRADPDSYSRFVNQPAKQQRLVQCLCACHLIEGISHAQMQSKGWELITGIQRRIEAGTSPKDKAEVGLRKPPNTTHTDSNLASPFHLHPFLPSLDPPN